MMSAMPTGARAADADVREAARTTASFEAFFEAERVLLYRVLFAITGSRHEAEDISQEAFLRVWGATTDHSRLAWNDLPRARNGTASVAFML